MVKAGSTHFPDLPIGFLNVKKILLFLFFLSLNYKANAVGYYTLSYIVQKNDSFASILKRFVKPDSIINSQTGMTKLTRKANPHVTNWKKLTPGTKIKLYIQKDLLDRLKFKSFKKKILEKLEEVKKKAKKKKSSIYPSGLKASSFYMASYGQFTQTDPANSSINFTQNSPFSLGLAFSYYPKNSHYSMAWSIYYSYLTAAVNNLTADDISPPPEIGGNFYNEYRFTKFNTTGYLGLDYERFSTFNMGGIANEQKVLFDKNTVLYLTFGASKLFTIFNKKIFTKLSLSKSLVTSHTIHEQGVPPSEAYTGVKTMLYLNYKFSKHFFAHFLYKFHTMDGPSKLTTNRGGIGFGYILK